MITLNPGTNRIEVSLNLTSVPPPGITPQANIQISNLVVSPKPCVQGGNLEIKVTVTNYGNVSGSATLGGTIVGPIGSIAIPPQTVTLGAGQGTDVVWSAVTGAWDTGIYTVSVDGLSDSVEITSPAPTMAKISGHTYVMNALVTCSDGQSIVARGPYGDYEFTVSPGTWTITMSASGYQSVSKTITVKAGDSVSWNYPMQLLVRPPGQINGDIFDAETGSTIPYNPPALTVTLSCDGTGQSWTQVVSSGFYYFQNLTSSYEVGYYTLKFTNSNYFQTADGRLYKYVDKTVTGVDVPSGRGADYSVTLSRRYYT